MIASFTTPEFRFLSNFYPCSITFDNWNWKSVEHAFQAQKFSTQRERLVIRSAKDAGRAKKLAWKFKQNWRKDWENSKLAIMRELIHCKFPVGGILSDELLATFPHELIEGNWWNDTFWGVCDGVGRNELGKLLMQRRAELLTFQRAKLEFSQNAVLMFNDDSLHSGIE